MSTQNFGLTGSPRPKLRDKHYDYFLRDLFTTPEGRARRKEKREIKLDMKRAEVDQKNAMTNLLNAEVSGSNQPSQAGGGNIAMIAVGGLLLVGLAVGIAIAVRGKKNKATTAPTGENAAVTLDEVLV